MTHDVEVLRLWIRVATVIAAIGATSFPIIYSFSSWRSRPLGRILMLQGVSLAAAMDLTVMFWIWRPTNILFVFWIYAAILTGIAVSTSSLTILVWNINHPRIRGPKVQLKGKVYDVTKQIALVWLPAVGALYFALAQIWNLPNPEDVSGSILAVDTFLGVVLGISSNTYNKSEERFAGTLAIQDGEEGSTLRLVGVDPVALMNRPEVTFKMIRE
jgi:putative holin Dp-1